MTDNKLKVGSKLDRHSHFVWQSELVPRAEILLKSQKMEHQNNDSAEKIYCKALLLTNYGNP